MRAEYINPFLASVAKTFKTMLDCETRREGIHLKDYASPMHEISGVIGLSGRAVGSVVLNLSRDLALKASSTMLMTECTEIDADVLDAVGELTNMIAGAAKAELAEYDLSIGLPNVITGRDHVVRFPSNVQPICMPFQTDWGPLTLEVGLTAVSELAPV